jgi:hypothetical protein
MDERNLAASGPDDVGGTFRFASEETLSRPSPGWKAR